MNNELALDTETSIWLLSPPVLPLSPPVAPPVPPEEEPPEELPLNSKYQSQLVINSLNLVSLTVSFVSLSDIPSLVWLNLNATKKLSFQFHQRQFLLM